MSVSHQALLVSPASTDTQGTDNVPRHLTQRQLAKRWEKSEASLERWRSLGIGPKFLKLGGQIRYRLEDVLGYEASCLRSSTSTPA